MAPEAAGLPVCYVPQRWQDLELRVYLPPAPRPSQVVCRRAVTWGHWTVDLMVLGASHAVRVSPRRGDGESDAAPGIQIPVRDGPAKPGVLEALTCAEAIAARPAASLRPRPDREAQVQLARAGFRYHTRLWIERDILAPPAAGPCAMACEYPGAGGPCTWLAWACLAGAFCVQTGHTYPNAGVTVRTESRCEG